MKRRIKTGIGLWQKAATVLCPGVYFKAIMDKQRGFGPFCTLSFDCDFRRDIEALPAVIALLERYDCTASFACIGRWVREYPQIHRDLKAAGHELLNHTATHPNLYHPDYDYAREDSLSRERFNQISVEQRKEEIQRCHEILLETLDYCPTGFRTPHFGVLHVDDVYGLLRDLGYTFSSSVCAAATGGTPFCTAEGIWEFPLSACPQHPFGVFDTWHSLSKHQPSHAAPGDFAHLFSVLYGSVEEAGGYINTYFDPKEVLESGELERILQFLSTREIPVVTYQQVLATLQTESAPQILAEVQS